MQSLKTVFIAGLLTVFLLYSNMVYSQPGLYDVDDLSLVEEATSLDFRFVLKLCNTLEPSRCNNSFYSFMAVYATINNALIDKLYFCSDQDSAYSERFMQIGDYNFDGFTDFRILTRKSTTLVEKTRGVSEYIYDYDYYMYDISSKTFYRHLLSSLRQVQIDQFKKSVTGILYNDLDNTSTTTKQPTSFKYQLYGEGLKYCTISPLSYPEPNECFGNFESTYHILDGRDLRSVSAADTLINVPIVKYENGFKFVKIRQLYPTKIDMEINPNIGYRNIYRIYHVANDQLLSEIIGEYESLFGGHSDSIYTADCNFDGYSDLIIKDEQTKTYSSIYFYNAERQSFYQYPDIKQLENLSIDFERKTISGKNTVQAFERNKYGQLREPKKKIWREYEFIGPSLKYVKVQTITFAQKSGRKVNTNYYIYDYKSFQPIRKKQFLSFSNSI